MGQKYAGWRKPESTGLIPGLNFFTSVLAVVALLIAIGLWFFLGSPLLAIITLVLATILIAPTMWRIKGNTAGELLLAYLRTIPIRRKEATLYRTGLFTHLPGGRVALPGYGSPITLTDAFEPVTGEDVGALVNLVEHTVTVILIVKSHDQESVIESVRDGRVAGWGNFLKIICGHGDIAGVMVVSETTPETGAGYRAHIRSRRSEHAPALAAELLDDAVDNLEIDTLKLSQRIAITFRYNAGGFAEGVASVSQRLPSFRDAIIRAGLGADWATGDDIIAFVKSAYNPAAQPLIEEQMAAPLLDEHGEPTGESGRIGLQWKDAGPTFHDDANPGYYLHDSARSMTHRCYEFPVEPVEDTVLADVLRPNPRSPYKRTTLVYRPHSPADAKRLADNDWRDSFAATQRRTRGLVDAKQLMRHDDNTATREDLAEGHGLVDVGMLVTITVGFDATGADALRAQADAGLTSSLLFGPCWTDQAATFLAALGIGVYADMVDTEGGRNELGS
ncbi:SCO6880 family protein [Nocardia sp. NPDC048505]|uniref:SCO6880 family protein n=1 Tax=Nocardia sp. NPDC048505 TaxID=3155756 RepID=UPI0033F6B305